MLAALIPALPTLALRLVSAFGAASAASANAEIAERNARRDEELARTEALRAIILAEQGWRVTAWIRPLFAYPLIVWWTAVIADSIWFHSGSVQALPAPLDEWARAIVAAYFVSRPIEKIARAVLASRR